MGVYRDRYYKGILRFDNKQDFYELKFAAEVYRMLGNDFIFVDFNDGDSARNEWIFAMRGLGDMPSWSHINVRVKPEHEPDVYEKAFCFRLEDIEKYFGCKAELHEIVPCLSNKEDLEIIRALYIGARRDLVRF